MTSKTKVHLVERPNFSQQLTIRVEPVEQTEENEIAVADKVFHLLEKELKCSRVEVIEGVEQTYFDFTLNNVKIELCADPWNFISLRVFDDALRMKIFTRLSEELEVVPLPKYN